MDGGNNPKNNANDVKLRNQKAFGNKRQLHSVIRRRYHFMKKKTSKFTQLFIQYILKSLLLAGWLAG